MKLGTLADPKFKEALRKLASQDVPIKTAFKLKGAIKRVNDELIKYDEVRADALNRHGKHKEDGTLEVDEAGNVQFEAEGLNAYVADINSLLAADVEIGTLQYSEIGEKAQLSTQELMMLDSFLVE